MAPKEIDLTGIGIGDVARICDIPEHTIRYWEKEFEETLNPSRTRGGQRRYEDSDIETIIMIKKLLWDENFSIKGARRILKDRIAGYSTPMVATNPIMTYTHDRLSHILAPQFAPA